MKRLYSSNDGQETMVVKKIYKGSNGREVAIKLKMVNQFYSIDGDRKIMNKL